MDRSSARTIKLDGKIVDILCTANGCFCYTENSVRKIRTPEEIDPENTNESVPFVNALYRKSGTRDYITARVVIQSKRFMDTVPTRVDKEVVLAYLMDIETNLLLCKKICSDIEEQIVEQSGKCIRVCSGVVDKFPTIEELDIKVYQFLMSAKQVQQIIVSIFNEFHDYKGDKMDGPNISILIKKMKELGTPEDFLKCMEADESFYKLIADIRNAQEHPNKSRFLKIDNFMLHSDGKIYVPHLQYYKDGLQFESDIVPWMKAVVNVLINLVEVQMMYNVAMSDLLPDIFGIGFNYIPEEGREEACPVAREAYIAHL